MIENNMANIIMPYVMASFGIPWYSSLYLKKDIVESEEIQNRFGAPSI